MHVFNLVPVAVELQNGSKRLSVEWDDGTQTQIPYDDLRSHCACSFCRAQKLRGHSIAYHGIEISDANSLGSSGLQLIFSDGHDRGIFPWHYLHAIGSAETENFLDLLQQKAS